MIEGGGGNPRLFTHVTFDPVAELGDVVHRGVAQERRGQWAAEDVAQAPTWAGESESPSAGFGAGKEFAMMLTGDEQRHQGTVKMGVVLCSEPLGW